MVLHAVVLEPVGAHLVGALASAHLLAAIAGDGDVVSERMSLAQAHGELGRGLMQRSAPGATLSSDHDTGRRMGEANRILVLVPVLAAGASPRIPLDTQVPLVDEDVGFLPVENGNGHCARMNTASPFRGWYSLNAVPAALVVQA